MSNQKIKVQIGLEFEIDVEPYIDQVKRYMSDVNDAQIEDYWTEETELFWREFVKDAVYNLFSLMHQNALLAKTNMMVKYQDEYPQIKHHSEIDVAITQQIVKDLFVIVN